MDPIYPDYLTIRQALLQDSRRDQRIHHWIASQYDFALSEVEDSRKPIPASRADSPLLGFPTTATSVGSDESSQEGSCPSYEPLFYSPSQDSLSTTEQEFEASERERALRYLIQEMNLGRVFPCTSGAARHTRDVSDSDREKSLPPLPPPVPQCSPRSSPAHSRRPSHSYSIDRSRAARLPSISTTLSAPHPVLQADNAAYLDQEADLPTPTATPMPTAKRPAPLKLFSTFEMQRALPPSPSTTPTTNASTPALSPSSPLSLSYPQPQALPHVRSASFPESLFTASSGPVSPSLSAYTNTDSPWPVPSICTTASEKVVLTQADQPKFHNPFPSHGRENDKLSVPTPCESRWSLASSVPEDDEHSPADGPKRPSKRKRLLSLMSLLSPNAKEGKENRRQSIQTRTTPPSPASSSIYLADVTVNASSISNGFGLGTEDPNYNPYYDNSTSDSSSSSNRKNSLTSLGYGRRSFAKPKKRTLVVGGVKENEVHTYDAVRRWCESFGEIRSMSRKSNGDIHVEFRKASVAETVCRVRGNVALHGAHVYLSWFSGKNSTRT